ncbi:hypothetical protein IGS67_02680 [Flavimobilis sp. GY10621]|uniref:Uncharacterized protein n=1 Tax=Flavimobilis rhizosphaerae TaxID=2775421 RepID=A0ABR9DMP8_9MICO|nr:hypothetical protein [Flavimobilis rhizosphaerae]MBD9698400.1 hypothetical protein [Flavimobilis rhizosphaerae]
MASPDDTTLVATVDVLLRALRALGSAGRPDAANRLAARAWLALRDEHPRQAERINGTMHHLARQPTEPCASTATARPTQERT